MKASWKPWASGSRRDKVFCMRFQRTLTVTRPPTHRKANRWVSPDRSGAMNGDEAHERAPAQIYAKNGPSTFEALCLMPILKRRPLKRRIVSRDLKGPELDAST